MNMLVRFSMMEWLLLFSLCVTSCHRKPPPEKQRPPSPEMLMETNRYLADKDEEKIISYTERHGWEMTKTGTGLWYQIVTSGSGPRVKKGSEVSLAYTVELLDGTLCYSSAASGFKHFVVGHGEVEDGLEEGVLLLHQGDIARFILPPWLAYGVPGDRNKIPPRSVIVYKVEVREVK